MVSKYFSENNLMLNLNKGKTEFVVYGTAQKLVKQPLCSVTINGNAMNQAASYEYLGITLDNHLTMGMQIDKI